MVNRQQIQELVKLVEKLSPDAVNALKPFLDIENPEQINLNAITETLARYQPEQVERLQAIQDGRPAVTPDMAPRPKAAEHQEQEKEAEITITRSNP